MQRVQKGKLFENIFDVLVSLNEMSRSICFSQYLSNKNMYERENDELNLLYRSTLI